MKTYYVLLNLPEPNRVLGFAIEGEDPTAVFKTVQHLSRFYTIVCNSALVIEEISLKKRRGVEYL